MCMCGVHFCGVVVELTRVCAPVWVMDKAPNPDGGLVELELNAAELAGLPYDVLLRDDNMGECPTTNDCYCT